MGPRCTGRENNHSDGFVSPLLRWTQTCFMPFRFVSNVFRAIAEDRYSGHLLFHLLPVPDLSGEPIFSLWVVLLGLLIRVHGSLLAMR